jgi:hypothetical protein
MKCRHCGQEINILNSTCSACGGSQSLLDDDATSGRDWTDGLTDNILKEIDLETRSIDRELADSLSKAAIDPHLSTPSQPLSHIGAKPLDWKMGHLSPPGQTRTVAEEGDSTAVSHEDIHQAAQLVFFSRHVRTNALYRERAATTSVIYVQEDASVNAFATDRAIPSLAVEPPMICIFGGLAEAINLAALSLGLSGVGGQYGENRFLSEMFQSIGRAIVESAGMLPPEMATAIRNPLLGNIESYERDRVGRKARSFQAAMILTVIAHELGHICLGHTLGVSTNNEVSRNQEREADSFAASVTASSPFSDYIVSGGIFWWVIMTWVAASAGPHVENKPSACKGTPHGLYTGKQSAG